ncbi:MAG: hypothetical protein Ct9H300mP11_05890 [Chloroflexota bacterium]|nr:MAG: hypothetical protein Ct9H300mP11_05890 [Chloroflexota bacterium]
MIRENACLAALQVEIGALVRQMLWNSVRPAIGMNASVTMLLEIKEEVLLVPAQAVRSDKGSDVVTTGGKKPPLVSQLVLVLQMGIKLKSLRIGRRSSGVFRWTRYSGSILVL